MYYDECVVDCVECYTPVREAVDDVRYATTLRLAIEKAGTNAKHKVVAAEAAAYLDKFDVTGDLDEIRKTIVNYILKLQ